MDREWMAERLTEFARAAEIYNYVLETGNGNYEVVRGQYDRQVPTAKRILQELDPTLEAFTVGNPDDAARNARMGLGILADWDDLTTKLQPDSPIMRADALHPWVWDAARTFWESAHWRSAVQTAASAINAHTQTKVGRVDIADEDLMTQSFNPDVPKEGTPRLRFPGNRSDQTWKTRQGGAMDYARGCYRALRNPASHRPDEWEKQVAVESLAALSVLARWIEECSVETAE